MRETCWQCGGEGGYHDCGEDCCSCLHPDEQGGEFWRVCDVCEGEGELSHDDEQGDTFADGYPIDDHDH